MPSLNSFISFDAKFILGSEPVLQLTAKTTIPANLQENLTGYFSVVQPDGIEIVGSFGNPDVSWAAGGKQTLDVVLRKGQDGQYVQGGYIIQLYARHPDYTDGFFERDFGMTYLPVKLSIKETFDFYTPDISFNDITNFVLSGWDIATQSSSWVSFLNGMDYTQTTAAYHNPLIDGKYYAAIYDTRYSKEILYVNSTDPWLSVLQLLVYSNVTQVYAPLPMAALVVYLDQLKKRTLASCGNNVAQALYEKAASLYTLIRGKVCAMATTNLKDYFEEFYKLTHDGQALAYPKNQAPLSAYDFTTGCGNGGGLMPKTKQLRAPIGVNAFTITGLSTGATVLTAVRSGLSKGITPSATTDTEQLQIVNNIVTLPTGDIVGSTVVDGNTVGELFIFTYQ